MPIEAGDSKLPDMAEDGAEQPHKRRRHSHRKEGGFGFFRNNFLAFTLGAIVILIAIFLSLTTDQTLAKFIGKLGKPPELRIDLTLGQKDVPELVLQNKGSESLIAVKSLVYSFSFPINETEAANYLAPDPAGQNLTLITNQLDVSATAKLPIVGVVDDRVVYIVESTYTHERDKKKFVRHDIFLWNRAKGTISDLAQFKGQADYTDMMRSIKSHWSSSPAMEAIKP